MLHFSGRIPITIHPTFWLFAALIGYLNSMSFLGTLIWIGIIFVSVLFHEFGHALTSLIFGQKPRIELVALGGLTYHGGEKLVFWRQFFIVFNGPLFGLILFGIATLLLYIPVLSSGTTGMIINLTRAVNLFWTLVNLLPVLPLDGGQLLRIVLEKIFGLKGFKYTLITSMAIAAGISCFFFLYQAFIVGALFFLLAFQSYDTFRRTRHLSEPDRKEELKQALSDAEELMNSGQKEKAIAAFETIRAQAKEGMIYILATQYLAFLKYQAGNSRDTYDLLTSIRSDLANDALCLLHKSAFEQKDYPLVVELAGVCFQTWPTAETALRNAYAHASLAQSVPAIGWLQTAVQEGVQNLQEILRENCFYAIRQDPAFRQFLASLK
ncbi:MAG TPA: site-2 protease family protein [Rhabdochlamydiaceae bacterium]|nr:site-2 protease family protein [Rhabdochlamydiaceae bacterium]